MRGSALLVSAARPAATPSAVAPTLSLMSQVSSSVLAMASTVRGKIRCAYQSFAAGCAASRVALARTSGPVVRALRHGATPSTSISMVMLSTVRINTIMPSTAASVSDGVDVTVLTMSAATSSSKPSSIAPPSESRSVLKARPPLPFRFQVTAASAKAYMEPSTIASTPDTSKAWVAHSKNACKCMPPALLLPRPVRCLFVGDAPAHRRDAGLLAHREDGIFDDVVVARGGLELCLELHLLGDVGRPRPHRAQLERGPRHRLRNQRLDLGLHLPAAHHLEHVVGGSHVAAALLVHPVHSARERLQEPVRGHDDGGARDRLAPHPRPRQRANGCGRP